MVLVVSSIDVLSRARLHVTDGFVSFMSLGECEVS